VTAAWAAVIVSVIMAAGAVIVAVLRSARHEGRLEAILEHLVDLTADHEARIRAWEQRRR
jgi:hypothetical protein